MNLYGGGYISKDQYDKLIAPINVRRIGKVQQFSHLQAYECRAHMNRIFGFARWSADTLKMEPVFESEDNNRWTVSYRAQVRLMVCAPNGDTLCTYTEWAGGDAKNQPSRADAHDLAMKSAESQAFKRACVNLGDAFGISLYNAGSTDALVKLSLVIPEGAAPVDKVDVDAHVTSVAVESETLPVDDRPDPRTTSAAPLRPVVSETVQSLRARTAAIQAKRP